MGWYSTGPKLREADLDINELIQQFCDHPVLVICEVQVREGVSCDMGLLPELYWGRAIRD